MDEYEVGTSFGMEAENAEDAAGIFLDDIAYSEYFFLTVKNLRTGEETVFQSNRV